MFLQEVFTLPAIPTLNKYDSYDGNVKMEEKLNEYLKKIPYEQHDWVGKVILKFDEMKIKEKIIMNFYTNEITDFEEDGLYEDVLKMELAELVSKLDNGIKSDQPFASYILLFMVCQWDSDGPMLKQSIARYLVTKSTNKQLKDKIMSVINYLYLMEYIVIQVASDGASENVSKCKKLAKLSVRDLFSLPFASIHLLKTYHTMFLLVMNSR